MDCGVCVRPGKWNWRKLVTDLTTQRRRREDWNAWLHKGRDWQLNDFAVPPGSNDLRRLAEAEREVDMLEETLKLLATPEREAAVSRMRQLQNEGNGLVERAARPGRAGNARGAGNARADRCPGHDAGAGEIADDRLSIPRPGDRGLRSPR